MPGEASVRLQRRMTPALERGVVKQDHGSVSRKPVVLTTKPNSADYVSGSFPNGLARKINVALGDEAGQDLRFFGGTAEFGQCALPHALWREHFSALGHRDIITCKQSLLN